MSASTGTVKVGLGGLVCIFRAMDVVLFLA